jgi:protein-L-isoaspartate(D-aspartate) O-methyltransferase
VAADEYGPLLDQMVDQLRADGFVRSAAVEAAFRAVPRHEFLPDEPISEVYDQHRAIVTRLDGGVPVSSSSAPDIMAIMLERLDVEPGDRVLEIGTGTGYNATLLSLLATRSGSVTSIDIDPEVIATALPRLERMAPGVHVVEADGWLGQPEGAPFDRIEATVGVYDLSPHWRDQLRERGVLAVPLWLRTGVEALVAFERRRDRLVSRSVDPCGFMRLRGPHAGPERYIRMGEWFTLLEDASAGDAALLEALLQLQPSDESLGGELPAGWFARLSLREPDAIRLVATAEPDVTLAGLFDRGAKSLALVGDGRVRVYGGYAALRRLRDRLPELRDHPLDLRHLQVEAVPAHRARQATQAAGPAAPATVATRPGVLILGRPSFDLVLTEGEPGEPGL